VLYYGDENMIYEYKVIVVKEGMFGFFDDSGKQEKQLNEYGAQGWKLIMRMEGKKAEKYVFIREM